MSVNQTRDVCNQGDVEKRTKHAGKL
jgi:hypothetical protein